MKRYGEAIVMWALPLMLALWGCAGSSPRVDRSAAESDRSVMCAQFEVLAAEQPSPTAENTKNQDLSLLSDQRKKPEAQQAMESTTIKEPDWGMYGAPASMSEQSGVRMKSIEVQVKRRDTNRSQWFQADDEGYVFIPLRAGDYEITRLRFRDHMRNETQTAKAGWRVSVPGKSAYYLGSYRLTDAGQAFAVKKMDKEDDAEEVKRRGKKKLGDQIFEGREFVTGQILSVERKTSSPKSYGHDYSSYHTYTPPVNFPNGGGGSSGGGHSPSLPRPAGR